MKSGADRRSATLNLIRSYDHEKRISPTHSRGMTPTNTERSTNTTGIQRIQWQKKSHIHINYEKAQQLEVWQVARAATAAKFLFKPLKVENGRTGDFEEYTDGDLDITNNPTKIGIKEIEDLHGNASIGIVVSVGTARKRREDAEKFISKVLDLARSSADRGTDPESVHHEMQRNHETYNEFPYYRFDHPGRLPTELDDWEPKRKFYNQKDGGTRTIDNIRNAFAGWAAKQENIEQLKECAAALVASRRERISTGKWERFATGSYYQCRVRSCDSGDFFESRQFETHLHECHHFEGHELKDQMRECRKHWRYQPAPKDKGKGQG